MIKIEYKGTNYYYCSVTDTYYTEKYKRVTNTLSEKIHRANRRGTTSLRKEESEDKTSLIKNYFLTTGGNVISDKEVLEILKNKKSRHETEAQYLLRLKKRFNLKWYLTDFKITANQKSNELKKLLSKEEISYTTEENKNKTVFNCKLPLYSIDYQTVLERIDDLVNSDIL